ncbi:MAG: DUF1611 domain-containing protein [Saprospiraceae bacterium]|nr:DUF1611 domain-containing protein [Saprospiraceae bacterium]
MTDLKPALILAQGFLDKPNGKTTHGLIRGSEKFGIVGVIDSNFAGCDAGEVLDGKNRKIPVFDSLTSAFAQLETPPQYFIVGVAVAGGKLPPEMHAILLEGIEKGMHIINGLHEFLSEKQVFAELALNKGVTITDVRRPKKAGEMTYWSGRIGEVTTPRIAVLGMDCAVGKRTTARMILESLRAKDVKSEMISTGQTGWMQDGKYAFILDATLNDFVSGELETQIVRCFEESKPDVMILNGQSALRNPIGPCGAELLVSGQAKYVVLQAMPARRFYEGTEAMPVEIPSIESEIELIKMYGAEVIAVALNTSGLTLEDARETQKILRGSLGLPIVLPLEDGVAEIVNVIINRTISITK